MITDWKQASTRIIDYHLEERIEGKKTKINLSGSYRRKMDII